MESKNTKAVPVTILTGFLGAGKTTLLNRLIADHPEKRFAIIENEFGEIGIDNDLVIGGEEGLFEMSNGCICCTMNDELTNLLVKLIRSEKKFDHLLIETTGIAEPDGVAAAFLADPGIQEYFQLDGTIGLVDAPSFEDTLEERREAKKQITFADHIILNKIDQVEPKDLDRIEGVLNSINPFADISRAKFAEVETNLLQLEAYSTQSLEEKIGHVHHHHHSDVVTHSFVFDQAFDLLKLRHWINVLLMVQGARIYRIKGIVDFEFKDTRMIFQSVRQMHVFQEGKAWEKGEKRQSKLVFIGMGLKREAVERSLRSCLSKN